MDKLKSRKFWVCIGIALTGIGSTIAGIVTSVTLPNETLSLALTICGMALTGLGGVAYELSEAMVDAAAAGAKTEAISLSATSTSKELVESMLLPETAPAPVQTPTEGGNTDGE